jgi:hypothetical protein
MFERKDWVLPCPLCAQARQLLDRALQLRYQAMRDGPPGESRLLIEGTVSCEHCGNTGEVLTDDAAKLVDLLKAALLRDLHSGNWLQLPAREGGAT